MLTIGDFDSARYHPRVEEPEIAVNLVATEKIEDCRLFWEPKVLLLEEFSFQVMPMELAQAE